MPTSRYRSGPPSAWPTMRSERRATAESFLTRSQTVRIPVSVRGCWHKLHASEHPRDVPSRAWALPQKGTRRVRPGLPPGSPSSRHPHAKGERSARALLRIHKRVRAAIEARSRITQQSGLHLRVRVGVVAGQQRCPGTAVFGQGKFSSNFFRWFFRGYPAVVEECPPMLGVQFWCSLSPIHEQVAPLSFGTRHHRDQMKYCGLYYAAALASRTYNSCGSENGAKSHSMRPPLHRTQNRGVHGRQLQSPACGTTMNLGCAGHYRFYLEILG
jgi:hypothetical protein